MRINKNLLFLQYFYRYLFSFPEGYRYDDPGKLVRAPGVRIRVTGFWITTGGKPDTCGGVRQFDAIFFRGKNRIAIYGAHVLSVS